MVGARQIAKADIEYFVTKHSLHSYRKSPPKDITAHAKRLVELWQVACENKVEAVVRGLLDTASRIEEFELTDWYPDGHHERAAKAIRVLIPALGSENCPWRDLVHLLGRYNKLLPLANALWRQNATQSTAWKADLDQVAEEVWGDPVVKSTTIRPLVTNFKEFLEDSGVSMTFRVRMSHPSPHIACKTVRIDEDKLRNALQAAEAEQQERKEEVHARRRLPLADET